MLARVLFYPTLGFNSVLTKVTSRHWYDRIDDTVILGALPFKSITHKVIAEEKVKAMVSLNEDYELRYLTYSKEELTALGVEQLQLKTVDLTGTPSQEHITQAIDFIMSHRQRGNSVYLHCKAGRTRSATVAVCYLMQLHKWDPEKAVNEIKAKRSQLWLRDKQLKSVQCYYDSHVKSR